jgi:hypothetical protein
MWLNREVVVSLGVQGTMGGEDWNESETPRARGGDVSEEEKTV